MAVVMKFFIACLLVVFAQGNVEVKAKYVRDNNHYIYMESKKIKYKLSKKELTKEGVEQILKNKETELTLFIPPKAIVDKKDKGK